MSNPIKFLMDYDNIPGKGPLILFRDNGDGTRSLATVEDVKAFAAQEAEPLVEALERIDMKQFGDEYHESAEQVAHKAIVAHRAKYGVKK